MERRRSAHYGTVVDSGGCVGADGSLGVIVAENLFLTLQHPRLLHRLPTSAHPTIPHSSQVTACMRRVCESAAAHAEQLVADMAVSGDIVHFPDS